MSTHQGPSRATLGPPTLGDLGGHVEDTPHPTCMELNRLLFLSLEEIWARGGSQREGPFYLPEWPGSIMTLVLLSAVR